jgi:DNA-binding IscR family transcriptional regulator
VLDQVLRIAAQGGIHTRRELAQRLDVSEELLQQMIDELVRMGYLKPVAGDCDGRCAGCSFAAECAIGGAGRIWTLTGKGVRESGRST